jgi:hypothetical protein
MEKKVSSLNNEKGVVMITALVFLLLLTVIGIFATTTSNIEVKISGYNKISKMVFYAADSGIHYVAVNPDLYDSNNLDENAPFDFPVNGSPAQTYSISHKLKVGGSVSYLGKNQMPAGTGYSVGTVFAVNYKIESNSTGPNNAAKTVEAGFYRIGL